MNKVFALHNENGILRQQPLQLPELAADEVQIEVHYAGVNRADVVQLAGNYPPPAGASEIIGLEVSGTVVACGALVHHVAVGDAVCALLSGGGYASHVNVPAGQVLAIPAGLSMAEAGAICEVFATAWFNCFMLAELQPDERLLLHAGASAVGQAAIQLARWQGIHCFVTVGSEAKLQHCLQLGAQAGWNRQHGDFVAAVRDWGGADVILDCVGANYLASNQQVLNIDGRLVLIGLLGGRHAELDMGLMLMKRQRLQGSTLRSQPKAIKAEIMAQLQQQLWPQFSAGRFSVGIDTIYPWDQANTALARLASNDSMGKLLLQVQ
jgi:putative PIG3 family NAD(P)H quinone oxidoreductase